MVVPTYPEPLLITDAAVNIAPDLKTKVDIVQNAIDLALGLGIEQPRVAVLSAVETINLEIATTCEAAILSKMADRGQIKGGVIDGPFALDNAISPLAAQIKGIKSPVAGRANILLVPDLEAGNMLAKNLVPRQRRRGRHRARRARADHPHQPGRQRAHPDGVLRGGRPLRPCAATGSGAGAMTETLLVVNAGSSSIKFQLFRVLPGDRLDLQLKGQMEGIGTHPASWPRTRRARC